MWSATSLSKSGLGYQDKYDGEKAIELYEKLLMIEKELGRKLGMADAYSSLVDLNLQES